MARNLGRMPVKLEILVFTHRDLVLQIVPVDQVLDDCE